MSGGKGAYAALSHCWGKKQPLKTTRSTFSARKTEIIWTSIPKTFQDAITTSRSIGLEYIWIDSLCIIQDDSNDWNVESMRMMEIYANAYITIASTWADSGQKGCYSARKGRYVTVWRPPESSSSMYTHIPEVYARPEIDHRLMFKLPLCGRGWTLQEHVLSRRVIHFTPSELRFECRSAGTCECTPGPMSANLQFYTHDGSTFYSPSILSLWGDPYQAWRKIVEEYTTRALTIHLDKLPAVSGIARSLQRGAEKQRAFMGEYLAGVWSEELVIDLLWTIKRDGLEMTTHRAKDYRAPSWSWASIEGPVEFSNFRLACVRPESIACRVLEAEVTPSTSDPYGQISAGHIRVHGMVMKATLRRENAFKSMRGLPGRQIDQRWTWAAFTRNSDPGEHYFEADACVCHSVSLKPENKLKEHLEHGGYSKGTPICVLQLVVGRAVGYRDTYGDKEFTIALVLKKSKRVTGAYERIGLVVAEANWNWFLDDPNHAKAAEITIV